jgi:hypothetical protein
MILLWILALGLGAAAQLASLLASSKFATANGSDLKTAAGTSGAADPGWTAFMRGM